MKRTLAVLVATATLAGACGGSDDEADSESFLADIRTAVDAVESELGGEQEFFEITATPQLTNIFVAVDGATAAVPYVYLDGALQPPAPRIEGAAGQTFAASAIDFDESTVLSGVRTDLPTSTIDAFSIEGGPGGFVRYIVSARSEQGGVLDVVVAAGGAIIEVNPL